MPKHHSNFLEEIGTAIGVGLLAGLAGTLAISLSQKAEMQLDKRKPSTVPADAVAETLDLEPVSEEKKEKVSQEIHWLYGTSWGMARGLLSLAGFRGWPATLAHFAAVWGSSMIMLPSLKLEPPVNEQNPKTIAIDGFHHAVYATATGLVFDAILTKE
jgi:hypothetical protein